MLDKNQLSKLREVITENLRIQKDSSIIEYVDVGGSLADVSARQNHAIFGRRGCGKTLILHYSAKHLPPERRAIYLNCEDFKHHSFPNVLTEILIALLGELSRNATGWFGRKRRIRDLLAETQSALHLLQGQPDVDEAEVKSAISEKEEDKAQVDANAKFENFNLGLLFGNIVTRSKSMERQFRERREKIERLNVFLPRLKENLKEFFELSTKVKCVFIQIDDLYHLKRVDQPFVVDYMHRLCKDLPIYFKVATLRHNSSLYLDVQGQPIGAQERHDYQPIEIDYNFSKFRQTEQQNRMILHSFAEQAGLKAGDVDGLFKGEGFSRLVMAGGGVPRDVLSLFLQVLSEVQSEADPRIGKDSVRLLSREVFERRIEELKQDCKAEEQDDLLRGIYVIRGFSFERRTNIFLIRERDLQKEDLYRALFYRLLDYRIIHSCANALTHKSFDGTFQAFAMDIGSYAHLRKLQDRFNEIDVSDAGAKEKMRSAPVLEVEAFKSLAKMVPDDVEQKLLETEDEA